jgi:hypothetical protein
MKRLIFLAGLTLVVASGRIAADEPEAGTAANDETVASAAEEEGREARPTLRVLRDPYEISSFYRSSAAPSWGYFEEIAGGDAGPYAIASYYRSGGSHPYGYSRFWTNGYDRGPRPARGVAGPRYGRSIGENGDLFLLAPTFLAPVGPLTGAFFTFGR